MLIKNATLRLIAEKEVKANFKYLFMTNTELEEAATEIIIAGQYFNFTENEINSAVTIATRFVLIFIDIVRHNK